MRLYVDGGCKNNQDKENRQAYGSFAFSNTDIARCDFGNRTSNEAEYLALLEALNATASWWYSKISIIPGAVESLLVCTDSALIDGHINKNWKCSSHLIPLRDKARKLLEELGATIIKVPRDEIVRVLGH